MRKAAALLVLLAAAPAWAADVWRVGPLPAGGWEVVWRPAPDDDWLVSPLAPGAPVALNGVPSSADSLWRLTTARPGCLSGEVRAAPAPPQDVPPLKGGRVWALDLTGRPGPRPEVLARGGPG